MSVNEVGTLISQYGFPIVMCFVLFWSMEKQNERYDKQIKSVTDAYNELRIAIIELTTAIKGGVTSDRSKD